MAPDEKPYRVYRGGRRKGKVPAVPRGARPAPGARARARVRLRRDLRLRRPSLHAWRLIALGTLAGALLWLVVWSAAGFLALRSGVLAAQGRLPPNARAALDRAGGSLLSDPTTILVLGLDTSSAPDRAGDRRSDAIMLVRTDPSHHLLAYLSIPGDLLVEVGGGAQKIDAAYQDGGAALAIRTVEAFAGVPIDHVVIVDFNGFERLINAQGGVSVDVPENILSNRFDCPYPTKARCREWKGWRFDKGEQQMDGQRALTYSRVGVNRLGSDENDLTRTARQQAVLQAATSGLVSFSSFLSLPFDGGSLLRPLATDLSPHSSWSSAG